MSISIPTRALEIPGAWHGKELAAQPERWIMYLSNEQIAELEYAADQILNQGLELVDITKDKFHLPTLSSKLKPLTTQLTDGIGFTLIKHIPVENYSIEKAAIIFYGLGTHLGNARMQNAKGHVLGHVRDLNMRSDDPNVRIYQTNERQTFHTDSSDVVALLCLKKAKQGGESLLVSAVTIFNEMLRRRPDLVGLLFDPIATDRRGEVPEGMNPYFSIPVFSWYKDFLTVIYQRQYIDSAQRFDDAFRLTDKHIEALNMFDDLANDPNLNLSMQLEPGDMQFVYNHNLLHDRTGFEDWPELENRRHLLRLWLSAPNDRPLPKIFKERYGSIEIGNRGGVAVEGLKPVAPLEAV